MSVGLSRRPVAPSTQPVGPTTSSGTGTSTGPLPQGAMRSVEGPGPDLSRAGPSTDTPMLDGLDGGSATQEQGPKGIVITTTMRTGAKGRDVERLQEFLGLEADGRYGPDTEAAVRAWQAQNGLDPDGVIGPDSRAFLASNATGVQVTKNLRTGSRGKDVEALQQFLGLPVDGSFGPDTRAAVIQFQMDHGLEPDGIIGKGTRAALAGGDVEQAATAGERARRDPEVRRAAERPPPRPEQAPRTSGSTPETAGSTPETSGVQTGPAHAPKGELRSRWHSDEAFVPKYASTAYSESGVFRGKADPYAVGAISNPSRKQDLGGKTYGVYQFESSVYRDGSTRGKKAVEGSSAMRFLKWEGNPYGAELSAIVKKHGMASAQFDEAWKRISHEDNKGFGEVQEKFMELEREKQVGSFFDRINASEEVRKDPRLVDLVMGTHNQYASLSNGIAKYVAARNKGGELTADELGVMIQDYKRARVKSHFKSSPKAHKGIYNRIAREKAMFQ